MTDFSSPDGSWRLLTPAQMDRVDKRSRAATKSVRAPELVRVLVVVAWNSPKGLDGRVAPMTRVLLLAFLVDMNLKMSAQCLGKILKKMEAAKLIELEGSNVRASAELLDDLATLETGPACNLPMPESGPSKPGNVDEKTFDKDSSSKSPDLELEDLETLIQALVDILHSCHMHVSTDVMAASKQPMRQFLDAAATVAAKAAKGEYIGDLTAEIRKAFTDVPTNRVSSKTFAAVWRLKRAKEVADAKAWAETQRFLASLNAAPEQSQSDAVAAGKHTAQEHSAEPRDQTIAEPDLNEGSYNAKVHNMFLKPDSSGAV